MDYARVKEKAEQLIVPIVESLGYEVVEIECKYANKANGITVFIYKKGGITLDDCERVNNALDEPLEKEDITNGANYVLNISSPGLDRPIVTDRDYERNLGTELEADFTEASGKKKKLIGTLDSYDTETATFIVKSAKKTVRRDEMKLLKPYINFKSIN
ncbi:MAG: ribosome maturation factor RimP [Clostridia bacterium]|nr:ribosome maturation factor RimP [Clostridia bacterium]